MATLRLTFPTDTGAYVEPNDIPATYETEEFIRRFREGLWTLECEKLRRLDVGQVHDGGGGAMPEWRVTRID